MVSGNGPGMDHLQKEAARKQRMANDQLDSVRRGIREASTQSASDVERSVFDRAKKDNWSGR